MVSSVIMFPLALLLKFIVPELCVKVLPVLLKSPVVVSVLEVAVKFPPVLVYVVVVIVESPPLKFPLVCM